LRRRLIDYIRVQRAGKRPSAHERMPFEDLLLPANDRFEEVLFVHEGLDRLAEFDRSLAELVELVYFGGVPIRIVAEMRGVSEKTVDRHLDLARRWLEINFRSPCPQLAAKSASSSDA
jgi:DNA-directed RNA polymerase specialized sigma24 family protein